jgi:hypothetical protein
MTAASLARFLERHASLMEHQPALGKQIFNVAIAKGETDVEPNRALDDRGRVLVASKRDACHSPSYRPTRSAPFP